MLLRLPLLLLPLTLTLTVFGQILPVQPCRVEQLEPALQVADEPGGPYTITINFRNTSVEPCFMGPPYAGGTRLTLAPGGSLHQNIKSITSAAAGIASCTHRTEIAVEMNEWMSSFALASPSLVKPLCSRFTIGDHGDYLPGEGGTEVSVAGATLQPSIQWKNDPDARYSRKQIPLTVVINDSAHQLASDDNSCPKLLLRVRNPRAAGPPSVRVQEVQSVTCKIDGSGGSPHVVEKFDASDASKWVDGEYALQVSGWVTRDGHYTFVGTADPLRLSVVGGKFIRRRWGSQTHGLGVDLTLDKEAYALGEDIPLHIAMANFSSTVRIVAAYPDWDPPAIAVAVRDRKGNLIPASEGATWVGHGTCGTYAPGVIVQDELKLSQMGLLPREPGVYSVVAVWNPTAGPLGDWNCLFSPPSPGYRIESAPAVFTVLPPDGKQTTERL